MDPTTDVSKLTTTTRGLLQQIVEQLVDDSSAVKVASLEGTQATIFEISVSAGDIRRVIGRRGRTADALRELLMSMGGKHARRYMLEVVEPTGRMTHVAI